MHPTPTFALLAFLLSAAAASGAIDKQRLVWVDDPTTTVTVGWNQVSGSDAVVYYGTEDLGTDPAAYPLNQSVDRSTSYRGMANRFARLSGLAPDTAYYFVIADSDSVSERFWFRTAPDMAKPFHFISGGDSRNNRTPRQRANRLVAKFRPLFVAFTGDMTDDDTNSEWQEWFDDWELTTADDGRMTPILPHRGNHERSQLGANATVYNLFDTTPDNYYALSFGGNLLRYYVLNSEMTEGGTQGSWLDNDLESHGPSHTHLVAGYHKPMRPHYASKSEGSGEYNAWAQLFFDHGVDLVCESDSHVMKRTYPVEPSTGSGSDEGFIRNDSEGTVYIGEGCWGAPLRSANDDKAWTAASGVFNAIDVVYVFTDRMENITVNVDYEPGTVPLEEGEEMGLPTGLSVWRPASGTVNIVGRTSPNIPKSDIVWTLENFTGLIPPNSGPFDDYDGDGSPNIVERVLGGDMLKGGDGGRSISVRIDEGTVCVEYTTDPTAEGSIELEGSLNFAAFSKLTEGVDYILTTIEPAGTAIHDGAGAWAPGSEFEKAFDGNTATFYDCIDPSNGWVGVQFDSPVRPTALRLHTREGYEDRMLGATIDVQDETGWTTVHTIGQAWTGWRSIEIDASESTAIRFHSSANGYCNVAEMEVVYPLMHRALITGELGSGTGAFRLKVSP